MLVVYIVFAHPLTNRMSANIIIFTVDYKFEVQNENMDLLSAQKVFIYSTVGIVTTMFNSISFRGKENLDTTRASYSQRSTAQLPVGPVAPSSEGHQQSGLS